MIASMGPSHFKKTLSFATEYSTSNITKYVSERTGMSAVVVDRKGPKVQGFFTLATEIFDDSGAPHTLEHLCFMGSKSYRYKGVLDRLATRAYSDTNAWTATDHTAYTLDTAGWEGFAQILPVYLEHVLLPTLTDAGCYTEVHHINGEGEDAGVVYSEMQGVQNLPDTLMNLDAVRRLYPEGVGFRYETGGMMEALRVLTADRIREFHKDMYQPKNLCLIVVGEVDHADFLNVLDKFEDSVINDIPDPSAPWKRPWVESKQPPPLIKSTITTVDFPEKDESMGEVLIGLFGPDCNDPLAMAALESMGVFLAGSSVSILEHELVEIDKPWASSIQFYTEDRPNTVIWLQMTSVETERLAGAEKRMFEVLRETAEKPLDLDYMVECVRRTKRQRKFQVESTGYYFSNLVIADFLFGKRDGSTLKNLETLGVFDVLEKWTEADWKSFLRKWFSENPHVSVLGRPSAKLAKKIKEDEEKRVAAQVKKFGPEGLKRLKAKLEEAKAINEQEIPNEILERFPVPGVESIHFIDTVTARAGLAAKDGKADTYIQNIINRDLVDMPLYLHFEHVPTNFVHVNLLLPTASIPVNLRPLLPTYMENFFDTPVFRDGTRMEFEQVVAQLEKDTINYAMSSGSYMDSPESIRIRFQVEPDKYEETIKWLKILMWDSIFDPKRLAVAVSKMRSDIPEEKRDGKAMAYSVNNMVALSRESIGRARDTLVKARYLKRIEALLKDNPDEVVKMMEELRHALCKLENIRVLVIADVEKLKSPVSAWKYLVEGRTFTGKLSDLDRRKQRLTSVGMKPGDAAYIISLPTIDSSYSVHVAAGPDSMSHPQLPALMVAISYLDAIEGPLWCAVRGTGLAYGTGFQKLVDSGQLQFAVYRSPDAYKAWDASKKVVMDYITGAVPFDKFALEGAVSSVVVSFANEESNMSGAGTVSFVNQVVHNIPKHYNMELLKKVRAVTVDEVKQVMRDLILPVFMPDKSITVVVSAPVKTKAIQEAFQKKGFRMQERTLKSFEDDYDLHYGIKEGEEDDDEDAEEGEEGSSCDEDEEYEYGEDEEGVEENGE